MPDLRLTVLSLRYSSWSMRPWLALQHAGADFSTDTVELPWMGLQRVDEESGAISAQTDADDLPSRREKGSVTGLFPVLHVGDTPIHESLAICEWVAETHPTAGLWPDDPLERAQARSLSSEMASGLSNLRQDMGCHVFARVPTTTPRPETQRDIDRVLEIWSQAIERSGGPFLFGPFGIVDCMYFPVITRFRTYSVALPPVCEAYAQAVEGCEAVQAWLEVARVAPTIPVYDDYIRSLGGELVSLE